ncbi:MAG: hypothetical protein KDK51_11330, partial [Deltaproteobacteria bacterium]|nr:hypothetical protein [Deltaproteobacteria bacterium]
MRYYQKITFVLLALFCLPAWAQQDEVILVDHTITLSGDVIASKQQAYESVLVKALLMASQSIASPELFQNNYQLLREKFAEDPKSYVQDYQYLERTTRGQQYYLKLKVDPKWIVLKNKLADWGFLGFQSKPNIQVEPFVIHQKEHQKITTSGEYWSSKVVSHLRRMSLPAKTVEATSQVVPNTYTVQSKIV